MAQDASHPPETTAQAAHPHRSAVPADADPNRTAVNGPPGARPEGQNPPDSPPKRGRGRPPGPNPRVRRKKPSAAASGQRPEDTGRPTGPTGFDSTPGTEGEPTAQAAGADVPALGLPAAELARVAVEMLSQVAVIGGRVRYPEAIAEALALSTAEKAVLTPLLTQSLESSVVKMDPGTAFCVVGAIMFGFKVIAAERMMAQARGESVPA